MKKILKGFDKFIKNFWVQLIALIVVSVGIFLLGAFISGDRFEDKVLEILTGTDLLGVFLAALISLIVAKVLIRVKNTMEESLKLEDDHHKIISRYSGHKVVKEYPEESRFSRDGELMVIDCVPQNMRRPRSMVKDRYCKEYKLREEDISDYFDRHRLRISGVDVFANVNGDTSVVFRDTDVMRELPGFVRENAAALLAAHSGSSTSNNVTIRLKKAGYDEQKRELVLDTERSQYFYMLVTNRCMDYSISDTMTLREVYEFNDKVSPLEESKLGNQIGINGLVFTSDGYLLIEKRGKKKTTWKGKLAQPISLALKEKDILPNGGSIDGSPEAANDAFRGIIFQTLQKNYGIDENMIAGIGTDGSVKNGAFDLKDSFLGLARDLIEGGKPNMYFYIALNVTAAELKAVMEQRAKDAAESVPKKRRRKKREAPAACTQAEENAALPREEKAWEHKKTKAELFPSLEESKLERDLYLVKFDDIGVDFGYSAKLDPRNTERVRFRFYPCVNKFKAAVDGAGFALRRAFNVKIKKECGEALLTCLYYAEVCRKRICGRTGLDKERSR